MFPKKSVEPQKMPSRFPIKTNNRGRREVMVKQKATMQEKRGKRKGGERFFGLGGKK